MLDILNNINLTTECIFIFISYFINYSHDFFYIESLKLLSNVGH